MQSRTLVLNNERSELSFIVKHMGFLEVTGTFEQIEASIDWVDGAPYSIQSKIEVVSISTSAPERDKTLLGEGYLHAKQFPNIGFESTSIQTKNEAYFIIGMLQIKDVKRNITIPFQSIAHADQSMTISGETSINRSDFQLDFGAMDGLIGDEIKIQFSLVFM